MIKYFRAPDIEQRIAELIGALGLGHIDLQRLACIRSRGSAARRTVARCHAMPRIMQAALGTKAYYVIEVIAEKFDRLSESEQTKTLIHELLHIPRSFGGGFKYHSFVSRERVEHMYKKFVSAKRIKDP
ncbi:MAG: putative metallopeptidase [Candidatus Aenigmatarchaeota archaeon]